MKKDEYMPTSCNGCKISPCAVSKEYEAECPCSECLVKSMCDEKFNCDVLQEFLWDNWRHTNEKHQTNIGSRNEHIRSKM